MGEAVAGSCDVVSSILLCDWAGPPSTDAMEEQK